MFEELVDGAKRNPIWFGAIGVLSAVQGWLSWEFWGVFTDAPTEQAGLRAIGLAFVGGEVVALDMASRAGLQHEHARATTLRAMWLSLALLNLSIDINALSRVLTNVESTRADEAASFQGRQTRVAELDLLIDRADDPFPQGRLLTVPAYDAALRSKAREIELGAHAAMWRQRQLERERGDLEAAREVARQVALWQAEAQSLRAGQAAHAAPKTGAIEFQPLTNLVNALVRAMNTDADQTFSPIGAEQVRGGIAIAASLAMKLMLTFGIWAGLDRRRSARSVTVAASEPGASLPAPVVPLQISGPPARRPAPRAALRFGRKGVQR